jgi:arylsulfatase A-like enzyme/Flp pilus assembly protein TadD
MTRHRWVAVLLALAAGFTSCHRGQSAAGGKAPVFANAPVIIVSIDTLRADHLPVYGYRNVVTPAIDAFRNDAILYEHAYSQVPLTLPSHVSMLTGLLPPGNGVRNNIGFNLDTKAHPMIPQILKAKGYATGAAVSAYVLRGATGIGPAFDFFDDRIAVQQNEVFGRLRRPSAETAAVAQGWIDGHRQVPFFFFLHLFDPHAPYEPAPQFRGKFALPYDGAIATADLVFGDFIADLKRQGIYDRALIILMSDHGEGLGDHGEDEHGIFLYMEDIHVPLMVKLPSSQFAKTSVAVPVELIDILPTIARTVGADVPAAVKGRSLVETALDPGAPRQIYSESFYGRIHLGWKELRSLVDDRFHYIEAPRPELYATSEPAEKKNVLADERRVYRSMAEALGHYDSRMPVAGTIDPEEAKKLAALGYLSTSSSSSDNDLPDPKDRIADLELVKHAMRVSEANPAEGLALLGDILQRNLRFTDAWILKEKLLERMGRLDEAIETQKRAIESAPSLASDGSLVLANLLLMTGQPKEAAEHAALGMSANPGSAHIILGRAALAQGNYPRAETEARQAMESYNFRAPALLLLAQCDAKQNIRLAEAMGLVDQALQYLETNHLPMIPLLHFVRGDILARMGKGAEAVAAFNEELRLYPQDLQAYANLAVVYLLSGDLAGADRTLQRMVAANPNPSSWRLAIQTCRELGANALADEWQRRARSKGVTVS